MSTIDEVSRSLGRIEAHLSEQGKDIAEIKTAIAPLPVLVDKMAKIEPVVEDYKQQKWRTFGFATGLAAAGGSVAGYIAKLFSGGGT